MACDLTKEIATDLGCIPTDPVGFATKFYGIALGVFGGLAVLFLIIGGYQIIMSSGNPQKIANGKKTIYITLGALALVIFAGVILQVFLVDILHVPGIKR